ncbi:hypothetical protein M3Y94_01214800 [Aphelenchoides besseyi]|nr:hypothetical protein M3Y94_01214800 [Aphelenchoides besseyi]KAI6228557.1 Protein of unknown function DUF1632 domain containing protein [Aphelenchoides besseyi]
MNSTHYLETIASTTVASSTHHGSEVLFGYLAMFGSCVCFGCSFLPLKWSNCGDGVFVNFIQCATIFAVGFIINLFRTSTFEWIAGISGCLYASAGILAIPIISSELGVGLGMLIWATVQVLEGYCVARFGLFGTRVQDVRDQPMNYIGVFLTLISGIIFVFVKTEQAQEVEFDNLEKPERSSSTHTRHLKKLYISKKKLFYIFLAVLHGLLLGLQLAPITYIKENYPNKSQHTIDYLFSFYSTTFIFGLLYFAIYAGIKRERSFINGNLVLPSVGYGILWAVAMSLLVYSTERVPQTISWPVIARLPPIIGVLLDIVVFRAIKGKKNFLILAIGIAVGCLSVVLVTLSNSL